jgi:NIMA (never in mitosis gene a)-related kinase
MFKDIVHPNIARVKKTFRAEGEFCSLSEFCDGGDLNVEIRRRSESGNYFKEQTLLTWFTHIACGLKKMHDKGIAHR